MEGRSVWRQVLSICLLLFALIRLGISCSKMNNNKNSYNEIQKNQLELDLARLNNLNQSASSAVPVINNSKVYNDVFYNNYKYIDSLNDKQRRNGYIVKLKKDSLINIDYSNKFKALKNSFFQNTYDDSLRFAIKTPKNLNIFIHSFESNTSLDSSFKDLKRNADLKKYRLFINNSKNSKMVCYNITKQKMLFRGVAFIAQKQGMCLFIEFESNKLSQSDLEYSALSYVSKNIVSKKATK